MMRILFSSLLAVLGLVACSHDDKQASSPDVALADAGSAVVTPVETDAGASDRACDAVRCRGGMVCKIVDGKPACVTE